MSVFTFSKNNCDGRCSPGHSQLMLGSLLPWLKKWKAFVADKLHKFHAEIDVRSSHLYQLFRKVLYIKLMESHNL